MGNDSAPVYTSRAISDLDSVVSESDWVSAEVPLPPRLVSAIPKRIQQTAKLAIAVAFASAVFTIQAWSGEPPYHKALQLTGIGLSIVAALIVIRYVNGMKLRHVLLGSLCIEVVTCLFISVGNPAYELRLDNTMPGATWIVPIIIMFPFLIPTPPRWTKRTSIICIMTVPVGTILAFYLSGRPDMDPRSIPLAMVSPTLAAIIAIVGASLVYEIGMYAEQINHAGNFKLGKEIGKGGMGVVYEGKHNRLPMMAAIKFINNEQLKKRLGGGKPAIERFGREAGVLAELCSPHTVEIYDFDLDDEGKLFYVMELLQGWDLNTLVDHSKDPIPPARVAYLLAQACGALAEAHEMQVIHRDVKPSNIMACRYGRDLDFVKVLDFGIMTLSKEEREPANPSWSDLDPDFREGLTKGTLVIGTPDYMSPEQAANEPLDAQSDIYALGCVAYYLLTGKLVFPGGTDQEKLARHRHEPPPRPSENTKQHIPPALDDLVVSCLSKRKEDRPRNADQLAAQLLSSVSESWTVADIQSWWATNDLPKRNTTAANSVSVSEVVQPAQEKHNWVSGAWQRFYELVW